MGVVDANAVVAKGEFARLANVTPGRVSQWIAEGKLTADALEGEGRSAKVRVGIAMQQLKLRLDTSQRFGNGLTTRLDVPAADQAAPSPSSAELPIAPAAPRKAADDVAAQIQLQRLEQLERQNRRERIEEQESAGLLTSSAAASQSMGRLAAQLVTVFEGGLSDFASAIAAQFQIPQRDVLHLLRAEFRKVRGNAAETFKRLAADLPQVTEFEIEETSAEEAARDTD